MRSGDLVLRAQTSRRSLFSTLVISIALVWTSQARADDWAFYFLVDNVGIAYAGSSTSTTGVALGSGGWSTQTGAFAFGQASTDFMYLACASDQNTAQGFAGSFTNLTTGVTRLTGSSEWEVFPAGAYALQLGFPDPWPINTHPTQSQVNDAIAYATANNLWTSPTGASGYDLNPATATSPYAYPWFSVTHPDIPNAAEWTWYESGQVPSGLYSSPFEGGNHSEFLVFRISGGIGTPCELDPMIHPPDFVLPPSPACGSTFDLEFGSTLNFTVEVSDQDLGEQVTLEVTGPAGVTYNPPLPATGNPVSTDVSWTTTTGDGGLHTITFTATDEFGCQSTCEYYINVCDCQCWADPECDGVRSDILDVIHVIGGAFRGCVADPAPGCPYDSRDVDADGSASVLDVVRAVNVSFRNGTGYGEQTCDPGPSMLPAGISGENLSASVSHGLSASNLVVVESKTVAPSTTGVQVGVSITNDVPIIGLVLPLEFRTITPGSYIATSFSRGYNTVGRLHNSPLGSANPDGPPASITQNRYPNPGGADCSSIGLTYQTPGANVDFVSPDATLLATVSQGDENVGDDVDLDPGADPSGVPSYFFTFDVTGVVGSFKIDTCCVTPGNHLLFAIANGGDVCDPAGIVPNFVPGIITIGTPTDCAANTTTDPFLVACPKGDSPFRVYLKDGAGDPIEGYSNVTLDFSACPGGTVIPSPGKHPSWPIVDPIGPSDENGMIQFNVFAGGDCADCDVTISTQCGFSTTVPVHSVDVNGNLCVEAADHSNTEGLCRDYNNSGTMTAADYFIHTAHLGHCAPLGSCDNVSISLRVTPEVEIAQGDQITIDWELTNVDNLGICNITSIEFYHYDCASSSTLNEVAEATVNQTILPGGTLSGEVTYTNPDALDFCIEARVYTNCCATYASQILPMTLRNFCSIGDACVVFYCSPLDITATNFFDDQLLAEGWTYDVQVLDVDPIGLVTQTIICTGPDPQPGQTAVVVIEHTGYGGVKSYTYKNEPFGGDVCGRLDDCEMTSDRRVPDCVIDVLDVVCMINYIFQGGQSPCPTVNVDLNCDCSADIVDIVRLVNTAFRGQPPPERCVTYTIPNCWD